MLSDYQHLGNFSACEAWAARWMCCDDCMVSWVGCWDNFQCPKCGKGELPTCGIEPLLAPVSSTPQPESDHA